MPRSSPTNGSGRVADPPGETVPPTEQVTSSHSGSYTSGVTAVVADDLEVMTQAARLHDTVHRRSVADAKRLAWFVGFLALGVALATGLDETMAGIEADLLEGFVRIPAAVAGLTVSAVAVLFFVLALAVLPLTWVGYRYRETIAAGFRRLLIPSA